MNVKDNRSFWVYLLLSIVTCGLYSIYFWYVYVEDLNTIFYGDGEDSPNYIIVLLLSNSTMCHPLFQRHRSLPHIHSGSW